MTKRLPAAVIAAGLLLAASTPGVYAQTVSASGSKINQKEETGVIVLEGELNKAGTFIFRDNVVTYKHENRSGYPNKMKIDGKDFKKDKPFELGFMPDLSHAEIIEQDCEGKIGLELNGDELQLFLDQRKVRDEGRFRIVLSLVDPDRGVRPVDESLKRKPEKKTVPSKMDLVKTEKKAEEPPPEQETGRRTLPSKMDLVRIEHEDEEQPKYVIAPETGRIKRPSKLDLVRIEHRKQLSFFWRFKLTRPYPVYYPTKTLIRYYLKVPKTLWTMEDEEYEEDPFRKDDLWYTSPTDEQLEAMREIQRFLFERLSELWLD